MQVQMENPNQFAYITQLDIESPIELVEYKMDGTFKLTPRPGLVTITAEAPLTPEVYSIVSNWAEKRGPPTLPFYSPEWMCLYCASPNDLRLTHCDSCGAPRNWLLG